jgi:tricorn protease
MRLPLAVWLAQAIFIISTPFTLLAQPAGHRIQLANDPAVSPDGSRLAFSWMGEIWTADIDGGQLARLTNHEADDSQPMFSPDGQQLAFVSTRTGSPQIFLMGVDGSAPRQVTFHSAGYALEDWFPDGQSLLASGERDHFHRDARRLIKIDVDERRAERILADVMAEDAQLSPDGKRVLFTREGERWWRKGYRGERSAQVWELDLETGATRELLHEGVECMWPLWMPDGRGFYFTKGAEHGFDLWRYRFAKNAAQAGKQKLMAGFEDDSIVYPSISRDGSTLVFRHLFDLYRFRPGKDKRPHKIDLQVTADIELPQDEMRREFTEADAAAFTEDGLEIALLAGGDVWVMDTKLREPKRVTMSAGYEQDVVFSPDGQSIWYSAVSDGQVDVWRATRHDPELFWWQNTEFDLEQITDDMHVESDLRFTPDSQHLVFQQGRGDLVVMDIESKQKRTLVSGFSGIDFDISADSRWVAYSSQDDNFNSEIWIVPLSGESKPVNVSRHPDNDGNPRFSPDGKLLAFTGRRIEEEVDIYYVYLQEEQDQETSRQRRLEEALELMKKKRKSEEKKGDAKSKASAEQSPADDAAKGENADAADAEKPKSEEGVKPIEIDFEGIHERLRRISIPDSYERGLLFSPDGKKLAFSASIDGKRGWYTVEFPENLTPKLLTTTTGSGPVWSEKAGGILFLNSGTPAKLEVGGKLETYAFQADQRSSRSGWLQAGFDKAWLTMREAWYDERFANRNWDEVRRKYTQVAAEASDVATLGSLVQLMLGELNGSHLGFYPRRGASGGRVEGWEDETAHLGLRFDMEYKGPGLLVRDVLPDGPADKEVSQLVAGDVVLAIDGTPVDPALDLTTILNGRLDRDIRLQVRRPAEDDAAEEFEVSLRPISYSRARSLLYDAWLERNRQMVEEASQGKLGYLHIRAMDSTSFHEFERQLYNVGYGRDGLVIDVRDNGGGSTTDLLLTALTQPRHAITVPRGGGQGYPHDRAVFAYWTKPIIVLCNQNSYSNAEIFSHAIKTLGRGKVVGVPTAGGVVSTGSASVNDVGTIRVPFRGWFVIGTGEDMEMNGCVPDEVLWPAPGELPRGVDHQLDRAVELLLADVGEGEPEKQLIYATQRPSQE